MARKLPRWLTPDILTASGVMAGALGGLAYYLAGFNLSWLWAVSALVVYHWFADGVDGKTAKARNESRPNYGYFLDHVMDATTVGLVLWGIYVSSLTMTIWPLVFMTIFFLLMVSSFLFQSVSGTFQLSVGKLGGTEARFFLVIINALALFLGHWQQSLLGIQMLFLDWVFLLAAFLIAILFVQSFLARAGYLKRKEPGK